MATKKIDEKKTLKYAVAFYFCNPGINFMLGNKMYQHIDTVYDEREDNRGINTCEVVYNYKAQKYVRKYRDRQQRDSNIISLTGRAFALHNIENYEYKRNSNWFEIQNFR